MFFFFHALPWFLVPKDSDLSLSDDEMSNPLSVKWWHFY